MSANARKKKNELNDKKRKKLREKQNAAISFQAFVNSYRMKRKKKIFPIREL